MILNLNLNISSCVQIGGGVLDPLVTSSSLTYDGTNLTIGYNYLSPSNLLEANQLPLIKDVAISGTTNPGQVLTITFSLLNNTPYNVSLYTCKIYGSIDRVGGGLVLITTLTGTSTTFNYTLQGSDIGYGITAEITATLTGGQFPASDTAYAPYTAIVLLPASALDVFTQSRLQQAGIPSDWNTNASAKWTDYSGTGNYGYQDNAAIPQLTAGILRFLSTGSNRFKVKRSVTLNSTTGCEVWIRTKLNSTANSQALFSISNTHLLRINGGFYEVSAVSTGVAPTTSLNLIRLRWFNAATEFQINNGSVTTINVASFAISSADVFMGISYSLAQPINMDLYDFFISTRNLTSGEIAAVWAYFGY